MLQLVHSNKCPIPAMSALDREKERITTYIRKLEASNSPMPPAGTPAFNTAREERIKHYIRMFMPDWVPVHPLMSPLRQPDWYIAVYNAFL